MNITRKNIATSDEFPVTGSKAPDFLINNQLPELGPEEDGLQADINVLLAQNPGQFIFRAPDIRGMDERAKRQLLMDMQEALGIRPLGRIS